MALQVTNIKGTFEDGREKTGFYMDGYLCNNLLGIPNYLKKKWDVVAIVSGHGKVRVGKALVKGSKVLMSDGSWKNIEHINIGDKVISPSVDGKKSSIEIVEEKIGHKQLEMCEIKSSKDNSPLYKCCVEHNIPVRTLWIKTDKTKTKKPTEYIWKDEIYQAGDLASKNEQWFKNHCPKIITSPTITNFEIKDFEVNPYLLGLYLGDGWICSKNRIKISNADENIYNWLKTNTKVIDKRKDTINIQYDSSKLQCGTGAYNKKIPKKALTSSYEYRKRLFEGLLDTDAYINPKGFVTYTTASEQLALDVEELCKTLGCRASINIIYKNCQTFKAKRKYYNIYINTGELSRELNLLRERKKRLLEVDLQNNQNKDSQFETISINKINERLDGYCIQVSGNSKLYITDNYSVTHNSTLAFQVAALISWLLAGGRIDMELVKNTQGKTGWKVNKVVNPTKPIKFSLEENVAFSAMELKNTATKLHDKYGKNQLIIYDEGREGLEGARAMENLNKVMQDFFQECGFMGHVILIVLPNYFKLHEDYSVSRSLFLIDAFHDKYKRRGYFNFYNETDKEWLYFLGKKRIGITQKYKSHRETFWGRFTSWFPFDRLEYERLKGEALKNRAKSRREVQYKLHRDALVYAMHSDIGKLPWSSEKISKMIEKLSKQPISADTIDRVCESMVKKIEQDNESEIETP